MPIHPGRAIAAALTVATVTAVNLGSSPSTGRLGPTIPVAGVRLERAASCPEALASIRQIVRRATDAMQPGKAFGGPALAPTVGGMAADRAAESAAPAAGGLDDGSISGTNLQELGIDEPDLVKTDGRALYVLRGTDLFVVSLEATPRLLRDITLDLAPAGMLRVEDRLVVFGDLWDQEGPTTQIAVLDISDPERTRVVARTNAPGSYRAARLVDGTIRFVVSQTPYWDPYRYDELTGTATLRPVDEVVASISIEDLAPDFSTGGTAGPNTCDSIYIAPDTDRIESTTVFSLDPTDPTPFGAATVIAPTETVYATATSLYIASGTSGASPAETRLGIWRANTAIHRFDIRDPENAVYRSAGEVEGVLLNQWALSERDGILRVATTVDQVGGPVPLGIPVEPQVDVAPVEPQIDVPPVEPQIDVAPGEPDVAIAPDATGDAARSFPPPTVTDSESALITLRERGDTLVEIGRVDGLGRGERIHSVRYLGDLAAVVTFRQTDPLYLVDLGDPSDPRVLGELKIPGFSSYLHPIGADHLLGVGMDATIEGQTIGAQVSLFDIADRARPRRVDQESFARGSDTPVGWDHHAFLAWNDRVYLPVNRWDARGLQSSIVVLRIDGDEIERVGAVSHPEPVEMRRAVVAGDRLFTFSDAGMLVSNDATLDAATFIAWPRTPDFVGGYEKGFVEGEVLPVE